MDAIPALPRVQALSESSQLLQSQEAVASDVLQTLPAWTGVVGILGSTLSPAGLQVADALSNQLSNLQSYVCSVPVQL